MGPTSLSSMRSPARNAVQPYGLRYGLGFDLWPLAENDWLAGHNGQNTGWGAAMWGRPLTGDGLVVLTNDSSGRSLWKWVHCDWVHWLTGITWRGYCEGRPAPVSPRRRLAGRTTRTTYYSRQYSTSRFRRWTARCCSPDWAMEMSSSRSCASTVPLVGVVGLDGQVVAVDEPVVVANRLHAAEPVGPRSPAARRSGCELALRRVGPRHRRAASPSSAPGVLEQELEQHLARLGHPVRLGAERREPLERRPNLRGLPSPRMDQQQVEDQVAAARTQLAGTVAASTAVSEGSGCSA